MDIAITIEVTYVVYESHVDLVMSMIVAARRSWISTRLPGGNPTARLGVSTFLFHHMHSLPT